MHQHRSSAAAISDPMMASTITDHLASASGPMTGSGSALNQLGASGYMGGGLSSQLAGGFGGSYGGPGYGALGATGYYGDRNDLTGYPHYLRSEAPQFGQYSMYQQQDPLQQQQHQQQQQQQANLGLMGGSVPGPGNLNRDSYVTELRTRLMETQNNYASLKRELETATQKLGSSMHSIKSFWSPELKKERALRKEEATKYALISDQMKLMRVECQVSLLAR